ncbi:MAG: 16S rRNA (uracil(1498)-N(3))-methyltransferase [Lachnospiraceae bacterium]|nr:16S rRNA (uracil(1498)-N(3))-methyltransferase [Lachnospiraceae bacterium]
MMHIFADPDERQGDLLRITGSDYNHIRNVCRMKTGDELSVSFGTDGREYRYGIESFVDGAVICRLRFVKEASVELPVKVILFQGLPKADKMDFVVQKSVELGASEIIPVAMKRSVVRLDGAKAEKKTQRWQGIAQSAAEQSRRGIVPKVHVPMTVEEAVQYAQQNTGVRLLPYELQPQDPGTKKILEGLKAGESVAVFIGPEGGFEPSEVAYAREHGFVPISLGRRILRTETAALTFLSWLIYLFEVH